MRIATPEFTSKRDLFDYLIKHKGEMIDLKKSETKNADSVELFLSTSKAEAIATSAPEDTDSEIKRTVVGNTYYWLDSHGDVHETKCFLDSIKQRTANKISHLHDHIHQLTAKVGNFANVYEKEIAWRDLNVDKDGTTVALMGDSVIKRILNGTIFEYYKNGEIQQHSVGMRYITLDLAINDPEYKQEYAEWNRVFPKLGNPEKALQEGYFWIVKDAALIEISCVLNGSNEITPTLLPTSDPSGDSQKTLITQGPSADSLKSIKKQIIYSNL